MALSASQLRLFKQQLPLRLRNMSPQSRELYLSKLSTLPEFEDISGQYYKPPQRPATSIEPQQPRQPAQQETYMPWEIPQGLPWWQTGLSVLTMPFNIVSKTFAASVTAPWTPTAEGTQGKGWLEREIGEYEQTKMPWGVKFGLETLPWFAIPAIGAVGKIAKGGELIKLAGGATRIAKAGEVLGRTGVAGGLAGMGKVGQVAGKALQYSPWGLGERATQVVIGKVAGVAGGVLKKGRRVLPDLDDINVTIKTATQPTKLRELANLPGFKYLSKYIGGEAAIATKPEELAVTGWNVLRAEAQLKTAGVMAPIDALGDPTKIFGLDDLQQVVSGPLKGISIDDITKSPAKYETRLTQAQKSYLKELISVEDEIVPTMTRNGIKVNTIQWNEGERWSNRVLVGKVDAEGITEIAFVGTGGRPGLKPGFMKTRVFENMPDATKEGFRYLNKTDGLRVSVQRMYNRITDEKMANWLFERVPYRTTEVFSLPKASAIVNKALKKLQIKKTSLDAIRRDMPEVASMIDDALAIPDWETRLTKLTGIKKYIRELVPSETDKLFWATEKLADKRKTAESAISALQRVKRGERLPTGTIKAISKIIPEIKDKLSLTSKLTLDDLIKAGEEAAEYPKTLSLQSAYASLSKWQSALDDVLGKLKDNPNDADLLKQLRVIKRKVGFAKYRVGKQAPFDITKSPVSILKGKHFDAIDEMLVKLRGESYQAKTVTGKITTKFKGGLLKEFKLKETEAMLLRQRVSESVKRVTWGEAALPEVPVFAGKIFTGAEAKETVKFLRQTLSPQISKFLGKANQVNDIARAMALAGDMSFGGIQLIFMAGSHPKIYGATLGAFWRAFADPDYLPKFYAKYADTILDSRNLILSRASGGLEFTKAYQRGGLLTFGPLKPVGKLLAPFVRGYEAAMDTAGVFLKQGYSHLCTTPERTAAVEAFINEFRGLMSTAKIGINAGQRQKEAVGVLSPQYNRAIASLVVDFARGVVGAGGLRGQLARDNMTKGVLGIMAMATATSLALGEDPDKIADHLNPASSDFMTWNIAGQRIGPGSKVRSLLATLGKIIKDPEDAPYQVGRFLRGNFSPIVGTSMDLITGKNFAGDPTRDGLLHLTKTVIGENMIPIWAQSVIFEGGDLTGRLTRGVTEFAGGRAYPLGAYGEMRTLQDKLAQEQYGMNWDELTSVRGPGKVAQMRMESQSPELQQLITKAAEESSTWARGEGVLWNEYNARVKQTQASVKNAINLASKEFNVTGDGNTFRGKINEIYAAQRMMFSDLKNDPQFTQIKEYFERPIDESLARKMNQNDLAYKVYNQMMFGDDMVDEFGNYRFDEADRRRQVFIQKYGVNSLNYIEELLDIKRQDEPDALKQLREARATLKPYWNIETQIWSQYSKEYQQIAQQIEILEQTDPTSAKRLQRQYPNILLIRRKIALLKKQVRTRNPTIREALRLFY